MITRNRDMVFAEDGSINKTLLMYAILEHQLDAQTRMQKCFDYYAGKHSILRRTKTIEDTPNNKLVINHAKYITTIASGYLIGAPVAYSDSEQDAALDTITDAYKAADVETVDAELAKHASIAGKGVELLYMDKDARPKTAVVDPRNAFVIYEDNVENTPLVGIHITDVTDEAGKYKYTLVHAYTDTQLYVYKQSGHTGAISEEAVEAADHYFGAVPVNEYWNNEDETGDCEDVISLIDAYNLLQSDRINDKEQLVDALLVLTGVSLGDTEDEVSKTAHMLREQKMLELPPNEADAKYLVKQLTESDVQTLSDSIRGDIYSMSLVPELTDENFAGNASGVAMRYKLLGLEQLTKIKERWFREGLRNRLEMFANVLATKGGASLNVDTVQMTFTRSLPVNDVEQANMVSSLKGMVPDELLLKQLSFVDDPKEALDQLKQQQKEAAKLEADVFGYPYAQQPGGAQNKPPVEDDDDA